MMQLSSKQRKATIGIVLLLIIAAISYYIPDRKIELPPMTVQEKKARFISLIVPAVDHVYHDLMSQYDDVKTIIDNGKNNDEIEKLKIEYKASTNDELLMALKPHPKSIAIAQAAMESSWATSRFFLEANNIFGVWSFDENEPRIAALKKRGDKTIWVREYDSIEESVYDYYRTLARGNAFKEFRKATMKTDDPHVLVTKLDRYSEKGSVYGKELTAIIKFNNFDDYDNEDMISAEREEADIKSSKDEGDIE
ncbi:glucosaminidase domain-containing protein [Colwellia sp. M166]|uniref:glucosaminidase domain-containing protein n=1 Tax=Colwellia sp. M166 TaxID=2583805 RepID=UPI00211EF66F|nr:glucosaminidase domain-containing protein [Colwellia sp. M166]|tara:strand:- start:38196 stop:38951 length:756 start_codon:yes stop_codon:yes gene_type:complete